MLTPWLAAAPPVGPVRPSGQARLLLTAESQPVPGDRWQTWPPLSLSPGRPRPGRGVTPGAKPSSTWAPWFCAKPGAPARLEGRAPATRHPLAGRC